MGSVIVRQPGEKGFLAKARLTSDNRENSTHLQKLE
jgi:hypothetical protein